MTIKYFVTKWEMSQNGYTGSVKTIPFLPLILPPTLDLDSISKINTKRTNFQKKAHNRKEEEQFVK